MKKFILVAFSFCLLCVGSVLLAQQPDTALTLDNVVTEVKTIAAVAAGQDLLFDILYYAGILGALIHTIVWTQQGIKNSKSSPFTMAWAYWIRENLAVKVGMLATLVYPSKLFAWLLGKLPEGWVSYVVIGVAGILAGYFVDFVLSRFKKLIPKTAKA